MTIGNRTSGALIFVASLIVALVIGELVIGYVRYQQVFTHRFAISDVISSAIDKYAQGEPTGSQQSDSGAADGTQTLDISKAQNPFSSYESSIGSYRVHPFIDFSGAYNRDGTFQADYFGFRNKDSAVYFGDDTDFLVVFTGGSEGVGWSHDVSIAEHLEEMLANTPLLAGKKVRVLNLSMNSYALAHEINVFVHLAYNLRPNVVISHTGYNDAHYAPMVPLGFKMLGLNYPGQVEDWLPRLYELKSESLYKNVVKPEGLETVADAFIRNLHKYREIAQASGAYFIAGAQAHNVVVAPNVPENNHGRAILDTLNQIQEEVSSLPWVENFMDRRSEYEFVDSVHTAESAAEIIAREYFDVIVRGIQGGEIVLERQATVN